MSLVASTRLGLDEIPSASGAAKAPKTPCLRLVVCLFSVLVVVVGTASAQELRWVRGTVVAVTVDRLTILAPGPDLNITFTVDQSSLIHPGRALTWAGPPEQRRPTLPQAVRVGNAVEVHYARHAMRNYAAIVRSPSGGSLAAGTSMAGVVTAVSAEHLTVEADGRPETFAVESSTVVVARASAAILSDYIGTTDVVLISYRLEQSRRIATEIVTLRKHE